jgi:hypothetical protein
MFRSVLILLLLLAAFCDAAHAQIQVGLSIKRRYYVVYEPIIVTVTLTNLSGRDVPLEDEEGTPWFGFQVSRADDQPIAPHNLDYKLSPLILPVGQTLKRSVNLNSLFPIDEFGLYRIRANIFFAPLKQYFVSNVVNLEISEGKPLWQKTVGVPDGQEGAGELRQYTLLSFRQGETNMLYVRVQDPERGTIYCTTPVGRIITSTPPEANLDVTNCLHVLHVVGPRAYVHSRISLNGKFLGQDTYLAATNSRPALKRDGVGEIAVIGGILDNSKNPGKPSLPGLPSAPTEEVPKLSDRPANLPKE